MGENDIWPWIRFPRPGFSSVPGIAFDMRCVERVEQRGKGCRVWFKSGGSAKLNVNWTYLADLLRAWDPLDQDDEDDGHEEGEHNAQGT